MSIISVIILIHSVAQNSGKEFSAKHTGNADMFVNNLLDWALPAPALQPAHLDRTTLGKFGYLASLPGHGLRPLRLLRANSHSTISTPGKPIMAMASGPRRARSLSNLGKPITMASGPNLEYVAPPASDAAGQVASPASYPRSLYPEVEPFKSGLLDVGDGHQIYYDVSGNPNGVPAIFLHGGPGAGCSPRCRRFFDPSFYQIVILDQRGAGKSVPNAADDLKGSLVENTTPKLVGDIERLREHLGIDTWGLVLGGSWGSTLALAYAQAHPQRCRTLLLRGVFLFTPQEVSYLFSNGGTAGQHPQAWDRYCDFIRDTSSDWERERRNLLGAYWDRLLSSDASMRDAAAAAFVGYELSISKTYVDPAVFDEVLGNPTQLIPFAVMEVHYMLNSGFMLRGQLLDNARIMAEHGHHVAIVHGRADYVCQPQAAWQLTQALRAAGGKVELEFVAGAGHSDSEPGLVDAMVRATDSFKDELGKTNS